MKMHSITCQKKVVFIDTALKTPRRNAWKKSL